MDIDTAPPTAHREPIPSMQLDLPPPDEVMMEVDASDFSLLATSPLPTRDPSANPASPTPPFATPPPTTPDHNPSTASHRTSLPTPPVSLVSSSDVTPWPKLKLDQLFVEWLARPDSKRWLTGLLDDARRDPSPPSPSTPRAAAGSSSPTATTAASPAPPGSPVSRLFRTHLPFNDNDIDSTRSPPAHPSTSHSRTPNATHAADLDLGKSGSASPLRDLSHAPESHPQKNPAASDATNSDPSPAPDQIALERVADAIAGMNAHADAPSAPAANHAAAVTAKSPSPSNATASPSETVTAPASTAESTVEMSMEKDTAQDDKSMSDADSAVDTPVPASSSETSVAQNGPQNPEPTVSAAQPPRAPRHSGAHSKRKPIPRFYFPCGRDAEERECKERTALRTLFSAQRAKQQPGVGRTEFVEIVVDVVGLPSYFATIVYTIVAEEFPRTAAEDAAAIASVTALRSSPLVTVSPNHEQEQQTQHMQPQPQTQPQQEQSQQQQEQQQEQPHQAQLQQPQQQEQHEAQDIQQQPMAPQNSESEQREPQQQEPQPQEQSTQQQEAQQQQHEQQQLQQPQTPQSQEEEQKVQTSGAPSEETMSDVGENPSVTGATPSAAVDEQSRNEGQGVGQDDTGATNSDTTMGDANEAAGQDQRANGFHSGVNVATSGEIIQDPTGVGDAVNGIAGDASKDFITEEQMVRFYEARCAGKSKEERLFLVMRERGATRPYLVPSDFKPLLRALLMCHQGLAFLHATPEFQQRYSETVIERIYFGCTRQHNGRLTLQDMKRSKLLDTLMVVDEEEDINRERRFFSYEHFYVLYCRFWELDANHDLQIDREDLMRYSSHSLTNKIVDRIFGGYARPLDQPDNAGYMSYTDFIWFCLSEEDKTSDTAIDYWFRCVDRDGDGLITMYDMEFFYKEQLQRMESFGHEPVQVKDILCQLLDMIKPKIQPPVIRRRDLKRSRLAGNFFNVLFNLNKFFAIEARDPLHIRQEHATPELTDWDRFAALEYLRLSAEEEGEEDEAWEDVGEAANPLMAGEAPF